MVEDPFEVFGRSEADEAELRDATERLGAVTERRSFWSAIANDPSRPASHRALALEQLFRRHVHPDTTLSALAEMLDGAGWLDDGDVTVVTALGGKVPVTWSLDDTVFAIALPGSRGAVYLAVTGRFGAEELAAALRGASRDERVRSAVIRDVGIAGAAREAGYFA
jgi:hypothetical protein